MHSGHVRAQPHQKPLALQGTGGLKKEQKDAARIHIKHLRYQNLKIYFYFIIEKGSEYRNIQKGLITFFKFTLNSFHTWTDLKIKEH